MIVTAKFTTDVDLTDVVNRITDTCPGTTTISDDYYRDRLEHLTALSSEMGYDLDSRPMQCFRDVASRKGRQYHIRIQLTPETFADARIDSKGALITTLDDSDDIARGRLLDVLSQFPMTVDTH
jgi:hypothetical protein